MSMTALSVKQLNFYVKSLIEGDPRLSSVLVEGEISNLKNHYASGHIYFTLKDSDAAVNCVMFRSFASQIKFAPENGQKVIIRGRVSLYEKDGNYQIYAEEMKESGLGDIARKFEQTKAKLEAEGLFNPESKRKIPKFPKKIAVVTSPTGAAVRDILSIISRRFPLCEVIMCPVSVQGEFAVPEMLESLDRLYMLDGIDVCIIGRGGGSVEDLWAFNDEKLAYKIYESPFPVISAVGHETDFTICDFVADLRAPTPSAAAELSVPDSAEIEKFLKNNKTKLSLLLTGKLENAKLKLSKLSENRAFTNPVDFIINDRALELDRLSDRMTSALKEKLYKAENSLASLAASLDALSPLKTLLRGFSAVSNKDGIVKSARDINKDDTLKIRFADGEARAVVTEIKVN